MHISGQEKYTKKVYKERERYFSSTRFLKTGPFLCVSSGRSFFCLRNKENFITGQEKETAINTLIADIDFRGNRFSL